jgi:hypothetical protein
LCQSKKTVIIAVSIIYLPLLKSFFMRITFFSAFLSVFLFVAVMPGSLVAQDNSSHAPEETPYRNRIYSTAGFDGAIFSTAIMHKVGDKEQFTTPRFTLFFNMGNNFNYDISNHIAVFAGLGIKNIGYIEQVGDSTIKRRTYSLSIPLGVKLGNLNRKSYIFGGAGFDMPFNYKEKGFKDRGHKEKFNEWFSDRTPAFMSFVFVGIAFHKGLTAKLQYYPGNFLNTNYKKTENGVTYKPYSGYDDLHLLALSFGWDLHYRKHPEHRDTKPRIALR